MFSLVNLLQIGWTSLATSSYLVLFTLAFALVLKVNRVFNFTQAAVMTVAFYAAYTLVSLLHLPGAAGLLGAFAATLILSALLEIGGFRTLRRRRASPIFLFIFTLIVSELVSYLAMMVYGTWPTTIFPSLFWPVRIIAGVAVSQWDVPAIGATIATVAALFAFLRFTRIGRSMVAVADNPDLAEFYGIAKDRVYLVTLLAAGLISAVAMFLYGTRAQVEPTTALNLLLFAIAATIIGGIGNLGGAVATAVALGLLQNGSILFIPSSWQGFLLYAFLFLAIVCFPRGIRLPRRRLVRNTPTPDLDDGKAEKA
ncbi:MAG: branched-chain amino acid ABC transporter permease [Rhodospirillales bacterium]|nr:branched-chain amino acid ABC transporter permease [Rhodospirillales bacterium]